jgi:serine protease Do
MNKLELKSIGKTVVAAALGGALSLGAYKAFDTEKQQVIVQNTPAAYGRLASNYIHAGAEAAAVDFSAAAEVSTPAVVHIRNTQPARGQANLRDIPEPFREFFGDPRGRRGPGAEIMPAQSTGSGVIISNDGYIVTNNHVIDKADELEVTLDDKRVYKAKVIGTDPSTDLALIKIDETGLPVMPITNSDQVKVGQWVLAVGNPFNLESTVTAGIVSAKGRSINILGGNTAIESFIQTDAAVNPGNSGGALVNMNGELVGINTAIASTTGSYAGYAFAVPSNIVSKVIDDLRTHGKVQRAFLGIQIQNVNGKMAQEKDLKVGRGVYVESVMDEGAAKKGGIRQGDVIVKIDDRVVNSVAELQETIGQHRPGDEVAVVVNRGGSEKTVRVPLKNSMGTAEVITANYTESTKALGAEFENLPAKEASKLGLKHGVKVNRLGTGKLRSQTDMREGFIITHINKQPVKSVENLDKILQAEKGGVMVEGVYPDNPGKSYYYAFGM